MPPTLYDVMLQRDWKQKHFGHDGWNTACIAGALAIQMLGSIWAFAHGQDGLNKEGSRYYDALQKLGAVATRLFPERAYAGESNHPAVNFNNHPETTVDQVLKVCAEYDRECEAEA